MGNGRKRGKKKRESVGLFESEHGGKVFDYFFALFGIGVPDHYLVVLPGRFLVKSPQIHHFRRMAACAHLFDQLGILPGRKGISLFDLLRPGGNTSPAQE
jgi:hypothetical protein